MVNKNLFLMLFTILLLSSFVIAAAVQVNVNVDEGIEIFYPKLDYVPQSNPFELVLHTTNISNGKLINNSFVDCYVSLYDVSGSTIENAILSKSTNGVYHNISLTSGNFSNTGVHTFFLRCNTTEIGGAVHGVFTVTESGFEITEARSLLMIGLLVIIFLFFSVSILVMFNVENYIAKFTMYWVSHILFIIITFIGWQIGVEGLLIGTSIIGIFYWLFLITAIAVFPMMILSIAWIVYIHAFNEHFQKLIDKGEDPETAFAMTKNKHRGWFSGQ